jgi:hypothetical protein
MALKLPRSAERAYITTYGIVAIYVAALPSGPTLVRTSRDLLMSLLAIRRRWDGAIITAAFWMQDKREARLLCREVNAGFAHGSEGLLVANARDAQRRIENVAAHMGIMLTDNDIVLLRARAQSRLSCVANRGQVGGSRDDLFGVSCPPAKKISATILGHRVSPWVRTTVTPLEGA